MAMIAQGQVTLQDLTDIISQPTAPSSPKEGMLWMDTSKTPPVLMVRKGNAWVKQNDFKDDPAYGTITESIKKNTSEIQVNKEQIALKVTQTQVTETVVNEVNKTVKSVVSEYAKNQNATTPPTTNWSTTPPTWENGSYIWSRTKTTMMSGTSTTSDPVNITGAKGSTGSTGSTGSPGRGIKETKVEYQKSTSGTTAPTGTWTTSIPTVSANEYLWTRTTLTYTDGSTPTIGYSVGKMGANGATGPQGNPGATGPQGPAGVPAKYVIVSGEQTFKYTNNFANGPTPSTITLTANLVNTSGYQWSYRAPGVTNPTNISGATAQTYNLGSSGDIWGSNKQVTIRCTSGGVYDEITIVKISDGATGQTGQTGATGATGQTGAAGKDAYTVILSNETHAFAGSIDAALAGNTKCEIIAYKGTTRVAATIGTISGLPTGMTAPISNNGTTTAFFSPTVTTSMKTASGILTIPITVDGKSFTKNFTYSIAFKGSTGAQGNTGATGNGIRATTVDYQASSSGTTPPTGSWTTSVPNVNANQFLWTRITISYTNTSTPNTVSYSVGKMGAQGPAGATGQPGATGATGQGVESITSLYKMLNTKAQQPTPTSDSGWLPEAPAWETGMYIHTCSKIVYKNPTTTAYTKPMCDSSWEAVNDLEIGGRNLLPGSNKEMKDITFGGWDYYFPNDLVGWKPKDQIIGKIYLKPTNQDASCMLHVRYSDGKYFQTIGTQIKAGSEGYSTVAITIPDRQDILKIQFSIRHYAGDTPSDKVYYKEPKVEKGNKATDWSPAPEDTEQKFTEMNDKFAKVEQDLGKINISVGEITSANYAKDVDNKVNSFVVGTGSNVSSDVKGKVKKSMCVLTICAEAISGNSSTVVLNGIKSVSKTGEVLTDMDLGEVKLYLSSTGKYDEYTEKGIVRRVDSVTGGDAQVEGIEHAAPLMVQVEEGCTITITANRNVHSKHTVALTTLASIESSVSSINLAKNSIDLKVDRDGVIAAINVGVEDDESNILISADKIKLKGAVNIEALSDNLAQIFEMGTDKTIINGGYIKSGSIDLEGELRTRKGLTVTESFKEGAKVTFNVTPEGNVYMAGTVESSNFLEEKVDSNGVVTQKGAGWRIDQSGNAIFNQGEFRSKIILPRAGMSNEGNVRIWAGGEIPATALFRVLDSGDVYVEKGYFKGVFSGSVDVGGISITDEGKITGRGSIRITDNTEKLVTEIADDTFTVGTNFYVKNKLIVSDEVKVSASNFNFNDKIKLLNADSSISFNNDFANFKVNGTKFDFKVTDPNKSTDFEFSNPRRDTIVEIQGELKVRSNVDIGVVTIRKQTDGIDFLFI